MLYRRIVEAILPYSKRHPETQTDAKLIWTGLKHHLAKPENFHKFIQGPHSVQIHELPIHDKLKHKYVGKLDGIHFTHSSKENGSVDFGHSKGGVKIAHLHLHRVHGLGLHPDEVKTKDGQLYRDRGMIHHGTFMKSLRGHFDTFLHEFTHAHDHIIKGRNFEKGGDIESGHKNAHKYFNSWPEVHARKNQLAYKLDKVLKHNPDIVHKLKGKPLTGEHMARVGEIASHHAFSDSNKDSWSHANDKTKRTYSKIFRQVAAKHGLKVKHE